MSNTCVFVPFCVDLKRKMGENFSSKDPINIYYKNVIVALVSMRKHNANIDIYLATNIQPPNEYSKILAKYNINIAIIDFDNFVFDSNYKWSIAFYKLCCLKWFVNNTSFENYIYLDADTYTNKSIDSLVLELNNKVLLLDINHGLNTTNYRLFCEDVAAFDKSLGFITHFGGEFFAASSEAAKKFVLECERVYEEMIEKHFQTKFGDEFIVSIVAEKRTSDIKNASAYIARYWTDASFRLVSTNYKFDPVIIYHLPAEKKQGLLRVYKMIKNGTKLSEKKVWKTLHLTRPSLISIIKNIGKKIS